MCSDPPGPSSSAPHRRRSVDVGGLNLALQEIEHGMGRGWGGWDASDSQSTKLAELICDMYNQTNTTLDIPVLLPAESVTPARRAELINQLGEWSFEPYKLPDEEAFVCTEILFESLLRIKGLQSDLNITMLMISPFLRHLRAIYRSQNSYHNFKHALDVLQAAHLFLCDAGVVPPVSIVQHPDRVWKRSSTSRRKRNSKGSFKDPGILRILTSGDLLALYIAAIGHDVGHPGLSNAFMKNAQTPLSLVYENRSPLEQMHRLILMHIMRRRGMEHLQSPSFKRMLHGIILATDMSLHTKWMETFGRFVSKTNSDSMTPERIRLLCCQAIIKCADISNPARPYLIARNWASALHSEWATQAELERKLTLQVSVKSPDSPTAEAEGQIGFISYCTLPLLSLSTQVMPSLKKYTAQCEHNLLTWKRRLNKLNADPLAYHGSPRSDLSPKSEASSLPEVQPDVSFILPFSLPSVLLSSQEADSGSETPSVTNDAPPSSSSPHSPATTGTPFKGAGSSSGAGTTGATTTTTGGAGAIPPRPPSSISLSPSEFSNGSSSVETASTPRSLDARFQGDSELMRAAIQAGNRTKKSSLHRGSWAPMSSAPLFQ